MTITPRFRAAPERFAGGPSQGCQVPRCSPRCHLPALQPTGARRAADHGRSCSPEPCQTSASQLFWHFQALGWVTEGSRASQCLERVVEPPGLAGWGQRSEQTGPACSTQLFQRAAVLGRPTLPPRRPQQICWAFCLSAWGETPRRHPLWEVGAGGAGGGAGTGSPPRQGPALGPASAGLCNTAGSTKTGAGSTRFGAAFLHLGAASIQCGAGFLHPGTCSHQFRAHSLQTGARSLQFGARSLQPGACSLQSGARSLQFGACTWHREARSLQSGAGSPHVRAGSPHPGAPPPSARSPRAAPVPHTRERC